MTTQPEALARHILLVAAMQGQLKRDALPLHEPTQSRSHRCGRLCCWLQGAALLTHPLPLGLLLLVLLLDAAAAPLAPPLLILGGAADGKRAGVLQRRFPPGESRLAAQVPDKGIMGKPWAAGSNNRSTGRCTALHLAVVRQTAPYSLPAVEATC
jgi:hypothetical protein